MQCGTLFYSRPCEALKKLCSIPCRAEQTKVRNAATFWNRVAVGGPGECWPFMGYRNRDGYGLTHVMGRRALAHRAAKIMAEGSAPIGCTLVCHACDKGFV